VRLTNKKLREEKDALLAIQRKKRKREAGYRDKSAQVKGNAVRSCANCGRSSSTEWRTGPTGPKARFVSLGLSLLAIADPVLARVSPDALQRMRPSLEQSSIRCCLRLQGGFGLELRIIARTQLP
jgi:hypothetical protein